MWGIPEVSFRVDDAVTEAPVVTLVVTTPYGKLSFLREPEPQGTTPVVHGAHVEGASANRIGVANPQVMAQALMERFGYDGLVILGAARTTGACPNHTPRVMRFARRFRHSDGGDLSAVRTIDAMRALVRRGMVVIDAKRAIEAVVERRRAWVEVPMVEDAAALAAYLAAAGFSAELMAPPPQPAQAS